MPLPALLVPAVLAGASFMRSRGSTARTKVPSSWPSMVRTRIRYFGLLLRAKLAEDWPDSDYELQKILVRLHRDLAELSYGYRMRDEHTTWYERYDDGQHDEAIENALRRSVGLQPKRGSAARRAPQFLPDLRPGGSYFIALYDKRGRCIGRSVAHTSALTTKADAELPVLAEVARLWRFADQNLDEGTFLVYPDLRALPLASMLGARRIENGVELRCLAGMPQFVPSLTGGEVRLSGTLFTKSRHGWEHVATRAFTFGSDRDPDAIVAHPIKPRRKK